MSVCWWTLSGLLQLHPVIAVTVFVLYEVQPSQHLWFFLSEIYRQGECMGVNYGSSNYFIPVITGFHKKKNTSHGLWKDLDDLRLPVWKTDHLSLPFTPSCQDPWSPGLPGPGLQRVTSAATCLHPWAWSGSGRAGHRLSGQLGRGSLWVWVSLGFIWHP